MRNKSGRRVNNLWDVLRNIFLFFINNYVGLVLSGCLYKHRFLCGAGLLFFVSVLLVSCITTHILLFNIIHTIFIAAEIYFVLLAGSMLIWQWKSKKLGLKSLIIYPGPVFWLKWMLAKRCINIPVLDRVIEIHVNTRQRYHNWDDYNNAFEQDIKKIVDYLKSGHFGSNVTVTFNSFNFRIADKLEKALAEHGCCMRFKQVAIPIMATNTYSPARFRRVQRKMFGEVKSNREVDNPREWELLICNISLKGGIAVQNTAIL